MSSAGQQLVAGRIPEEEIASSPATADVPFTTEAQIHSVTAPLVAGRTYRVTFAPAIASDTANDIANIRIREDTSGGTEIQARNAHLPSTAFGWGRYLEVEHTALATANKTFVATGERVSGSGTCRLEASAARPTYMRVNYVRG